MRRLQQHFKNFLHQQDGLTPVEYSVMLALIIAVCIGAITTIGRDTNQKASPASDAPLGQVSNLPSHVSSS